MATIESLDDVPDPTAPRAVRRLVYFRRAYRMFVYWPALVFVLLTTPLGLLQIAAWAFGPKWPLLLDLAWSTVDVSPFVFALPMLFGPSVAAVLAICTPAAFWSTFERTWVRRLAAVALLHPLVVAVTSVLRLQGTA